MDNPLHRFPPPSKKLRIRWTKIKGYNEPSCEEVEKVTELLRRLLKNGRKNCLWPNDVKGMDNRVISTSYSIPVKVNGELVSLTIADTGENIDRFEETVIV